MQKQNEKMIIAIFLVIMVLSVPFYYFAKKIFIWDNNSEGIITKTNDYLAKQLIIDKVEPLESGLLLTWTNNTDYYINNIDFIIVPKNVRDSFLKPRFHGSAKPHQQVQNFVDNYNYYENSEYYNDIIKDIDADNYEIITKTSSITLENQITLYQKPKAIYYDDLKIDKFEIIDKNNINLTLTNNTNNDLNLKLNSFKFFTKDYIKFNLDSEDTIVIPKNSTINTTITNNEEDFSLVEYIEFYN